MALREIVDDKGVQWKVWDVTPAGMHPVTAAELFLGEYQEGWLAFESATERRRLAHFPADWEAMSREELLRLLKRAKVVVPRRRRDAAPDAPGGTATGEHQSRADREAPPHDRPGHARGKEPPAR